MPATTKLAATHSTVTMSKIAGASMTLNGSQIQSPRTASRILVSGHAAWNPIQDLQESPLRVGSPGRMTVATLPRRRSGAWASRSAWAVATVRLVPCISTGPAIPNAMRWLAALTVTPVTAASRTAPMRSGNMGCVGEKPGNQVCSRFDPILLHIIPYLTRQSAAHTSPIVAIRRQVVGRSAGAASSVSPWEIPRFVAAYRVDLWCRPVIQAVDHCDVGSVPGMELQAPVLRGLGLQGAPSRYVPRVAREHVDAPDVGGRHRSRTTPCVEQAHDMHHVVLTDKRQHRYVVTVHDIGVYTIRYEEGGRSCEVTGDGARLTPAGARSVSGRTRRGRRTRGVSTWRGWAERSAGTTGSRE